MTHINREQFDDDFFCISPNHGFLPKEDPLETLPSPFEQLQQLIDDLPVTKRDGTSGILSRKNEIVERVSGLKNYIDKIQTIQDKRILIALYRAYTFLASSYLLEQSYQEYKETGNYGKARNLLVKQIAQPLCLVSEKIGAHPWLDYSYSYALGNYVRIDKSKELSWDNLRTAVSFAGSSDERGFIMVHVDINSFSPQLIDAGEQILLGIRNKNENDIFEGLDKFANTLRNMNERRREMWKASNPTTYNDFRVFIMGIEGNTDLFGDGVIYEGVDDKPRQYRGQSGSQDTIIPYCDTLFRVTEYYPQNQLTEYLMDMRKYRPKTFQNYLEWVDEQSENIAYEISEICGFYGLVGMYDVLNEIHAFRNGHWQFVQKYIMMNTKYAIATGGTPITTWIPNQIGAVNQMLQAIHFMMGTCEHDEKLYMEKQRVRIEEKINLLKNQMEELKNAGYNIQTVYQENWKQHLSDGQKL